MKKFILSFLLLSAMTGTVLVQKANADICLPGDIDYDANDCTANGGTPGIPSGFGGGPGGGNSVPIDGGLSIMLAVGGALSARKALKNKKK